ncbi:D-alanyl-D-alanine carboxypeptidase family protein [Alicyclobacillus sacchari]|uniref:D-alanyl-D-alanine carboxypeptidase family protein n=2 Tax=Alicyclobacillus sacchari TaxID=392010 RepID=UPI001AB043E0|nr:D-alanyl-D-alanine carboxypeptidase [Alicyclobacillus sacchari]
MFVRSIRGIVITVVIVLIIIAVPIVQLVRPVPKPSADVLAALPAKVAGPAPNIQWPTQGQAALEAVGIGSFGTSGVQAPVPIASVTKVMTAYLVLQKHPLQLGQQGPSITVTPADVKTYTQDNALGESVVKVAAGEQLSEYQALEGLMLPSGNNMGSMLAKWCDGSQAAFVKEMNETAAKMAMKNTHYADPTGYSPASQSDAEDQMKLFAKAMENPVFRQIVSEPQAVLPVAGLVYNVDSQVGHGTIIGGKTGSTLEAGGCFVFAAQKTVANQNVLIVGAVLGQKGAQELDEALSASVRIAQDAKKALRPVNLLQAGAQVGTLNAAWAQPVSLTAAQSAQAIGWGGMPVSQSFKSRTMPDAIPANALIGTLNVTIGYQQLSVPVRTSAAIAKPKLTWRLKRL